MKVNEIFGNTIQGEAILIGCPMTFIRTSGCNLKCRIGTTRFNCDTSYHTKGKEMSVKEIINEVKKYPANNVCITGGSPSIQKDINKLIVALRSNKYVVQIEENGFMKFPKQYKNCIVVCSPKYYFNHEKWMFNKINKPNYFKFVYTLDCHEKILEFIKDNKIPSKKIFIMPEGQTRKDLIEHSEQVVLFCNQHNFRFSPREQIIIWNKKRGV